MPAVSPTGDTPVGLQESLCDDARPDKTPHPINGEIFMRALTVAVKSVGITVP